MLFRSDTSKLTSISPGISHFETLDLRFEERWEVKMLVYIVSAVACVAFGAYGMLFVMALCATSSSAERQNTTPLASDGGVVRNLGNCSLCERTVVSGSRLTRRGSAPKPPSRGYAGSRRLPKDVTAGANARAEMPHSPL